MARDTAAVTGAQRLSRRIQTLRANLSIGPLTNEIGALLLKRTQNRFDNEVDPNNVPWAPLRATTIEIKRRMGFGDKGKLKRTETLRKSIKIVKEATGALYGNTGAGVRIGVEESEASEYGRLQNYGNNKIRARRFLGVGDLDVKSVDSFLRRRAQSAME